VHSSAERLSRLATAFGVNYDTLSVTSPEGALEMLASRKIDYVVAEGREGYEKFLEKVEAHTAGALKVLLPSALPLDNLVATLRKGPTFIVLGGEDQTQQIVKNFKQVADGRKSVRHPLEKGVEVLLRGTAEGEPISGRVSDLSNRGASFEFDTQSLKSMLPGAQLRGLSLEVGDSQLLSGISAVVRRLSVSEMSTGQGAPRVAPYRVALEFLSGAELPDQTELVSNLVRKVALLREGLKRGGVQLQAADELGDPRLYPDGEVNLTTGLLSIFGTPPRDLQVGDVVRATFDVGETSYSFFGALLALESDPTPVFALKLPRTLRATRRRFASRFRPAPEKAVWIKFRSPFTQRAVRQTALDINAHGMSVQINPDRDICPVGAVLRNIRLRFPGGRTVFLAGRVKSLVPMGQADNGDPVAQFEEALNQTSVDLAEDLLHLGLPSLQDAAGTSSFREVWTFLEEAGFLYPEKLKRLEPILPQIERNMVRLLAQPSPIFKTVVFRKDGKLAGHLSAIRTFRHTWMVQHLAATGGKSLVAARALNLGITGYFEQVPDMEWAKICFRPDNRWPARVFGTFARRQGASSLSDLRTFHYCVTSQRIPTPKLKDVKIRPAVAEDLAELERLFVARDKLVRLQAEDLCAAGATLRPVSELYRPFDLERRREILVARRKGKPVGFALLEITSPGLNLSELTNAFTVQLWDDQDHELRRGLIAHATERYFQLGYPMCIGLADGVDLADFTGLGFQHSKDYMAWIWHRSLFRSFYEYVLMLFGRLRSSEEQTL
jgi:hypothetical protein